MFLQDKRAVSVIIGYVILVTFVIVIGIMVYSWMKTYVPREDLKCPDGTSLFIESYDCSSNLLTLNIKNNGKFNIGGYFIYVTTSPTQELAVLEISGNNTDEDSILTSSAGVKFGDLAEGNLLKPNDEETEVYDLTGISEVYSVEILPIRWQVENNRNRLVSCSDAKIKESVECDIECVADCSGKDCGDDGCGGSCGSCTSPEVCNSNGQCVDASECTDTCTSLGYECGTHEICGASEDCGSCSSGYTCNASGLCEEESSCNGEWVSPESSGVECDGGEFCFANCTCEGNYVPDDEGGCEIPDSVSGCDDYCVWLGIYIDGVCRQNSAQCTVNDQVWESGGNDYCSGGATGDYCCCTPE